jgi:hypothetical protein
MDDTTGRASGRFLLRIDPVLHQVLREGAALAGLSLNEYCARRLAAPEWRLPREADEALRYLDRLLGGALVGVVVYGSWARGVATAGSDVDLLIVVDNSLPLTRELYRRWDSDPPEWGSLPIEPHFIQLPGSDSPVTGTWAEVALDGIVLLDPRLAVSRWLQSVRHRLMEGDLVRRTVQGQPYWTTAA